jgi:hypothetical protein
MTMEANPRHPRRPVKIPTTIASQVMAHPMWRCGPRTVKRRARMARVRMTQPVGLSPMAPRMMQQMQSKMMGIMVSPLGSFSPPPSPR